MRNTVGYQERDIREIQQFAKAIGSLSYYQQIVDAISKSNISDSRKTKLSTLVNGRIKKDSYIKLN